MSTTLFSSLILTLLSLAGLICCLYLGAMQFVHRSRDASEEQLSHQFFSGITLIASALMWGLSAWSISGHHEQDTGNMRVAESLKMINQLPATAAGVPVPDFMTVTTTKPIPGDTGNINSYPRQLPFASLIEYEQIRLWLSQQLLASGAFSQSSHSGLIINLDEHAKRADIRTILQTRPELLSVILYPPINNLPDPGTPGSQGPTVFIPKNLLGQIYYTPLQGETAPIIAKLLSTQINAAMNRFH